MKKIDITEAVDTAEKKELAYNEKAYTWNNVEIVIKRVMSFSKMAGFITNVVDTCFDAETGEYIPGLKDFAIRISIVEGYTDLLLPQDIEQKYDMLYGSDVIDFILDKIDRRQLDIAVDAANEKINMITYNSLNEQTARIRELIGYVSELISTTGELFDGVSKDDVSGVMAAIKDGKIDEKKLVDAYIDRAEKE